jgi:nitrogen-specific signal transduction histidine kinase
MNLCANAAQAMERDGGVLAVEVDRVELDAEFTANHPNIKTGPYLKLTVTDSGHGMSPEVAERIFEPFFTTKRKGKGTGMGLSVVHGIVKNHGGTITVYSEPRKGSTFHVFLPVIEGEVADKARLNEELPLGTERVLFVDDEEAIVDVAKRTLILADDHELVRQHLRALLERHSDLEVVAEAADGQSGGRLAQDIHPELKARQPALRSLGISRQTEHGYTRRFLPTLCQGYEDPAAVCGR